MKIIDTFNDFKLYYDKYKDKSIEDKIHGWLNEYIIKYPELKRKCLEDYEKYNVSWVEVATEKVFPKIDNTYVLMEDAHKNILANCEKIVSQFNEVFNIKFNVNIVLYVGIGNGAGWATYYDNTPAVLLGLDKIAELGWNSEETLYGLISHELCHLLHEQLRGKEDGIIAIGEKIADSRELSLWNLYEEGFAQRCEQIVVGQDKYHEDTDGEWTKWCNDNKDRMKKLYIDLVDKGETTNIFYGSWFNVEGHSQVGYFLGCELIKQLQGKMDIKDIATLELGKIYEIVERYLREKNEIYILN